MIGRRRFLLAAILVTAAGVSFCPSASALVGPPLQFAGREPIARTIDQVQSDGGIRVTVLNSSNRVCRTRVRVVGLEPSATGDPKPARDFFPATGAKGIEPHRIRQFTLAPARKKSGAFATKLAADTYNGTVVARSRCGIAQRRLALTVPAPTPKPGDAKLHPSDVEDLTLPATNFLPSLLSPAGPLLFVVAWILLVLGGIRGWTWLPGDPRYWRLAASALIIGLTAAAIELETFGPDKSGPAVVAICAFTVLGLLVIWGVEWRPKDSPSRVLATVALVAVAAIAALILTNELDELRFSSDLEGQPGIHAVMPKSVAVSKAVPAGRVGIVADTAGDVVALKVTPKSRLRPENLSRAGTYNGGYDLNASAPEGSAKAVVTVRDWWPWAFLVIALGVAIGYMFRRWYQIDRKRELQRLEHLRLSRSLVAAQQTLLPDLAQLKDLATRLDEVQVLLDQGAGTDEIDAKLKSIRDDIQPLEKATDKAAEVAARTAADSEEARRHNIPPDDVPGIALGAAVASQQFDVSKAEDAPEPLSQVEQQIDEALELLTRSQTERERILPDALSRELLLASDPARIDEILDSHDLAPPSDDPRNLTPPPTVTLETYVQGRDIGATEGNVDDVFLVRAHVTGPSIPGLKLKWHQGGQTHVRDLGAAQSWVIYRFSEPGTYRVDLLDAQDAVQGWVTLTATGPSREADGQRRFAELDRTWTLASGALAIASGMAALYFVDPAWGTDEDYVKAILWGATVAEATNLLALLVTRTLPAKG